MAQSICLMSLQVLASTALPHVLQDKGDGLKMPESCRAEETAMKTFAHPVPNNEDIPMRLVLAFMPIALLAAYAGQANADNGQLLSAQCYQCHGPNGHSKGEIDSIAGKSASELYEELLEMKREQKVEIMHLQAKNYTDAELLEIANYLSTLH